MHSDVPVLKRCCFCLPLRYGLLTWGYFKLISDFMILSYVGLILYIVQCFQPDYRFQDILLITVTVSLLVADIALSFVFICGAHMKNVKCLRISYFYGFTILVLSILLAVWLLVLSIESFIYITYRSETNYWYIDISNFVTMLLIIFFQGYMLILLRSEIVKLNNAGSFRFTNNAAEAECTLQIDPVEQETSKYIIPAYIEKDKTNEIIKDQDNSNVKEYS